MAIIKGFNVVLSVGTQSSTTAIAASMSCTLNIDDEMIEVAPKTAGCREYIRGMRGWTMSSSGLYSPTDHVSMLNTPGAVYVTFSDGTKTYSGRAFVTSYSIEASYDGYAQFSVNLQGTGALTVS